MPVAINSAAVTELIDFMKFNMSFPQSLLIYNVNQDADL